MPADIPTLYKRIAAAASFEGADAAIRIHAEYEPIGGPTDKISPPTYPVGDDKTPPYLLEDRYGPDGEVEHTVLLDSRQSQANRCEEALQSAIDAGEVSIPHLSLETIAHGRTIRITSLQAPHRSRDAYYRDSETADGTRFDDTSVGALLKGVTPEDATPLYRHAPTDLVYGVWDSHRKLRLAPRFPRVYTSEIVGYGVQAGRRAAGRSDLIVSGAKRVMPTDEGSFALGDGKGSKKLSEMGHGSIPPGETVTRNRQTVLTPGGVTVRRIDRHASLGFAGLARVAFGDSLTREGARAARAALACVALAGDRLAFGRPAVFLRSGCELLLIDEQMAWIGRGNRDGDDLELSPDEAVELVTHAIGRALDADANWSGDIVTVRPHAALQDVIEESFFAVPSEEE
ncbi:MAG: type I-G CRISPR-associated RAMP protein Csb1/Cas7g [Euzebya sp.]